MRARLVLLCLLASGCASVGPGKAELSAPLRSADGRQIGTVQLSDWRDGVRVKVDAYGLTAGTLGMHLHEVGRCEDAGFTSAGAHWNPAGRKHGRLSPDGPHAGDLGNVAATEGGVVKTERTMPGIRLRDGASPLIDADGAALIIHERGDDEQTDPGGNSGDRIACAAFPG